MFSLNSLDTGSLGLVAATSSSGFIASRNSCLLCHSKFSSDVFFKTLAVFLSQPANPLLRLVLA